MGFELIEYFESLLALDCCLDFELLLEGFKTFSNFDPGVIGHLTLESTHFFLISDNVIKTGIKA
jgi:hypothetical protein